MHLATILRAIKFEHTAFALPWAYTGAVLAAGKIPSPLVLLWITLAMVGARSAAMAWNRLVDLDIDSRNPRTAGREYPRGLLSPGELILFAGVSLGLLLYAALRLNTLCLLLSPVAVFMLIFYSYTKRFTWLTHFFLGGTLGMAPVGGWLGVTGRLAGEPLVLWLAVTLWVAGFDVLYQGQDLEFDRRTGLHSIPSRFGLRASFYVALGLHALTLLILLAARWLFSLGVWFLGGVAVIGVIFAAETALLLGRGSLPVRLKRAFDLNLAVSTVILAAVLLDMVGPG
ncbi:MAG: UbiA family prenyltransferase [Firmicutes bacterium]|nr:UbiA family prenyltransferase [Bacillota bacterium]